MKKSYLYFNKKYKCVSFIVHYKGLTVMSITHYLIQCYNWSTMITARLVFQSRPFGVALLFAGIDKDGSQLYVLS